MSRNPRSKKSDTPSKKKDLLPNGRTTSFGGRRFSWTSLLAQTVLAAYAYAFMEWLFFATKPSFMDVLPIGKKSEIFFLTGLVLTALALPILLVLRIFGFLPGPTKRWQVFALLAGLIPAILAAALSLLLIDNFTYTIWNFGIVTSTGAMRAGYAVLAAVLLVLWYRQVLLNATVKQSASPVSESAVRRPRPPKRRGVSIGLALGALLVAVSIVIGCTRILTSAEFGGETGASTQDLPHIVLLGGDGLDARFLSLYGYGRTNTPNLDGIAESGLLAENHYTNAAHSTGSVFSMLTGKYPAETRLLYSPNILQGIDAVEHLPGILQRAGYTTVQIAFPYYLDAYDVNMQEGFDEVNGRSLEEGEVFLFARRIHWDDAGYFLPRLGERIFDRLLHIFFLREMPDPYHEVIQAVDPNKMSKMTDKGRMGRTIRTLREADGPMFIHVHLMDTHGPRFYPRIRVFSAGEEQDRDWMRDFFDDAILDFDTYVGDFVSSLQDLGLWENTLLIFYSDHTHGWRTNERIPLLLHFPGGEYSGRIATNTQNLDIAPTILDYLGLEKPAWMSGQSLLEGEPNALRPILSAGVVGIDCEPPDWWCQVDPDLSRPPFFQFGYIQMTVCQKMYTLNLSDNTLSTAYVPGHTAPCPAEDLPSREEARLLILDHLRINGFDVSSLE